MSKIIVNGIRYFPLEEIDLSTLKGATFITGYQGFGMVGYLTSRHIALELGLKKIGFIRTRYFPEATFYLRKTGIVYPFEVYYGTVQNRKLLVLVNHGIPHVRERTNYAEFLGRLARHVGVSNTILVGGLDPAIKESEDEKYRWIPIGDTDIKLDAPLLEEKHIIGPLALTIMFMGAYRIPGVAVFSYAELYRPDIKATIVAVDTISKILGISIGTEKLREEIKLIEEVEKKREEIVKALEGEVRTERKENQMYM
jgi:uncharacterized protein